MDGSAPLRSTGRRRCASPGSRSSMIPAFLSGVLSLCVGMYMDGRGGHARQGSWGLGTFSMMHVVRSCALCKRLYFGAYTTPLQTRVGPVLVDRAWGIRDVWCRDATPCRPAHRPGFSPPMRIYLPSLPPLLRECSSQESRVIYPWRSISGALRSLILHPRQVPLSFERRLCRPSSIGQ